MFFKYKVFDIAILIWSIITLIFLIIRPTDFDLNKEMKKKKEIEMKEGKYDDY